MTKVKSRFVTAASALLLASCAANLELDTLNQTVPSGSPFNQRLSVEYRDLANFDNDVLYSYGNTEIFARKGLRAATGETVLPEDPAQWSISDGEAGQLVQDRQKLLNLLDNGGRKEAPIPGAVAQARFDCWVERAEKSDTEDVSVCRSQFYAALEQIQAALNKPAPVVQHDELHEAMFLVFFDWNKSHVTPSAEIVLDTVADQARRLHAHRIVITGNADLTGTDRYNQKLSMLRAQAVAAALESRGFDPGMMETIAHGDQTPLVPTGKGVREPANRRAEIRFE
jgi:OOP family OmpA-OmpF porin